MTDTPAGQNCKADVKNLHGEIVKCGTFLPRGKPECPNRKGHMWKFKSGFCNSGWCEGTAAQDSAGEYVKTCPLWDKCNCQCHINVDKMFIMTGEQRILMENSKYKPVKSPFIMPDPLEIAAARMEAQIKSAPDRPMVAASNNVRFHETPTGKRARGQLEYEVLRVCEQFMKGQIEEEILTPQVIALEIDEVEPPSVGAIGAVFDRWVKLGFAKCEKKPVRFTSFTVDGQMHGLDAMKAKAKQKQKMQAQASARGSLRPRA